MRTRQRTTFETRLRPERVIAALVDFSEARPDVWPELDPAKYVVHEVGPSWALVTEGSRRPNVWARERYDWSKPGTVSWRAEASNFCAPGSGVDVTVEPLTGGGSRVAVEWQRTSTSVRGLMIVALFRILGPRLLTATYRPAFEALAAREARPTTGG